MNDSDHSSVRSSSHLLSLRFVPDWFCTGDISSYSNNNSSGGGCFHIVGRSSVDIIKSGGFKIGALEIEATMLEHPLIDEVTVCDVTNACANDVISGGVG